MFGLRKVDVIRKRKPANGVNNEGTRQAKIWERARNACTFGQNFDCCFMISVWRICMGRFSNISVIRKGQERLWDG